MPRYQAVDNTNSAAYAGWELMDTEAIPPKTFGIAMPEYEAKLAAAAMNGAMDQTMRIVELAMQKDQLRQALKMAAAAWGQAEFPAAAIEVVLRQAEPCYCDRNGLGVPGATCGDCPRDYNPTAQARKDIAYLLEAYRYGQFADDMFDHPSADCRSPCKPLREALRRHLDWLESSTVKEAP